MIWLLFACTGGPTDKPTQPSTEPCDACDGACVEEAEPATSRSHVEGEVAYPSYPPSSGDHDGCWAPWGVHTDVVQPENWVHNLEHGGVVFVYAPELAPADLATLTSLVEYLPQGRALLTPASDPMDALVAAVSWEHRLLLGCFDAGALEAFFWANIAHAPEDITSDPGSCFMDTDTADTADTGDSG